MMKTLYPKINIKNIVKLLITASILILFTIGGCKDSGTDVQPVKDPRNYSWTVDTLTLSNSAQTLMNDLWGTSPKNVYAVGWNDQTLGDMWHYDGNSWTDVKLSTLVGGNIGGHIGGINAVMGLSANNIWAVGSKLHRNPSPPPANIDSSLIIHFNGTSWNEVNFERRRRLADVYAQSATNVWACGDTTIYHYDGVKWTREYVPLVTPQNHSLQISRIISDGTTTYAQGFLHNNITGDGIFYFFKRSELGWSIAGSDNSQTGFGPHGLWLSPSGKLYAVSNGIFTWNGSNWINIFSSTNRLINLYGTQDNNIFIIGANGTVYHYNGQDLKLLNQLTNNKILYTSVWTDGTEVFICGFTLSNFPQKTIIWHGK